MARRNTGDTSEGMLTGSSTRTTNQITQNPLTGDEALERHLEWEAEGNVSEERQAEIEAERAQAYQDFDALYADTGNYEEGLYHFVDPRNMGSRGDSRVNADIYNEELVRSSDAPNQQTIWGSNTAQILDRAGLEAAFNSKDNRYLKKQFGDFDNYMAYMDERQQLIDSGAVDPNWWRTRDYNEQALDSTRFGLTQKQLLLQGTRNLLGGDPADAAAYSAPRMDAADIDMEALEASIGSLDPSAITAVLNEDANAKASAHWMNDDRLTGTNYDQQMLEGPMAALNEKYGISTVYTNKKGDQYTWNGTSYIQTRQEGDTSTLDKISPYIRMAAGLAVALVAGPQIGGALVAGGMSSAAAAATAASIVSSASQLIATGEVDIGSALLSAAGAGFAEYINPQLIESATSATSAISTATTAGEATSALNDILSMAAPGAELINEAGTLDSIINSANTIVNTVLTANTILDNIENNNGTPDLINPGVVLEEDETTPNFEGEYDENGNLIFNPDDVQVTVGNFDPDKVDDDDGGGGGGNTGDPTPEEIQAAEEAAAAEAAAQAAAEAAAAEAAAEAAAAQTAAEEAEDQDDLNGENTFPDTTTDDGTEDINGNPIVVDGTVIVTDGNETEDQYIYSREMAGLRIWLMGIFGISLMSLE